MTTEGIFGGTRSGEAERVEQQASEEVQRHIRREVVKRQIEGERKSVIIAERKGTFSTLAQPDSQKGNIEKTRDWEYSNGTKIM